MKFNEWDSFLKEISDRTGLDNPFAAVIPLLFLSNKTSFEDILSLDADTVVKYYEKELLPLKELSEEDRNKWLVDKFLETDYTKKNYVK